MNEAKNNDEEKYIKKEQSLISRKKKVIIIGKQNERESYTTGHAVNYSRMISKTNEHRSADGLDELKTVGELPGILKEKKR